MSTIGTIKTKALHELIKLAKESKDEVDFDLLLTLANELWHEADIDQYLYAEILRLYADWLEDDTVGIPKPRRHAV